MTFGPPRSPTPPLPLPSADGGSRLHDPDPRAGSSGGGPGLGPSRRGGNAARAGRTTPTEPKVEVARPADPVHGDFASNLAMRLARPYRMAPLAIAHGPGRRTRGRGRRRSRGARPIASAEVAAPGFLNLRLRDGALEADHRRDPGRPAGAGAAWRPIRPRSVNVEFVSANPTGPLHVGNARGAFIGDLLSRVLEAGGQRVTREYYFNDSGGQIREPRRLGGGDPARRAGPRGRLPGRLRQRPRGRASRTTSGPTRRPPDADTDGVLGRWAAGRVREGIEASLDGPRRPFRRLDERGAPARRGLGRRARSSACASAAMSTSRTARSGSARPTSATTRTGSSSARTASRPTSPPTSAT